MDTPDEKGFYTFESSSSSEQIAQKPIHLEKRFNASLHGKRNLNKKTAAAANVESKREAILQERSARLNQNFQKVKRIAKEMKDRRQDKLHLLSKSMALAETNRNQHIENRRAASKQCVERAKYIVLQNQYRSQQEQGKKKKKNSPFRMAWKMKET